VHQVVIHLLCAALEVEVSAFLSESAVPEKTT
jgi:hypothetical protein